MDNKVYDTLALLALGKFEEEFVGVHNKAYGTDPTVQRPFLFSQSCVSNEIKLHDYAYRMFRSAKPGAMQNNIAEIVYIKLGVKISNRTGNVDILEQDALKSFDKNAFNYFDGIASCYKSTTSDPYWDGKIRKKTYERPGWRTSKILYNA